MAIIVVLTLVGLGLRLGYAIEQPADPPPDADAYAHIAEGLFRDGSFDARPEGVAEEVQPSSAYSPGLPLFAAGVYELTGGPHLTLVLVLLALLGAATIPLTYLLGARFARASVGAAGSQVAGLIAAAPVAIYPALLDYHGMLLTEPLGAFLLTAGLVSYFAAVDRPSRPGLWAGTGALLGLLALTRPEYLPLAFLLPLIGLGREALRRFSGPYRDKSAAPGRARDSALAAGAALLATCVVLAPWAIRNAIELERFVPVSTGGGKALFIGTYVEADGDGVKLRELLLDERPALRERLVAGGPVDDPDRFALERVLAQVAAEEEPGVETDEALGRMGRRNLEDAIADEPAELAGTMAAKAYDSWTDAARSVMLSPPWRALQLAIVLLGLAGLALLAWRRRFEALVAGSVLLYMTAVAALLISSPRRELVVLPLLAALAGTTVVEAGRLSARIRPRR